MGIKVAKHGNKALSSKCGSADVLESMGLQLKTPLEKVVEALPKAGLTFLFAPAWHSSLIKLAPLRKSLGVKKGKKISKKQLDKAAKAGGKLGQRARFAKTLAKLRKKK